MTKKEAEFILQPIYMKNLAQMLGLSAKERKKLSKYVNDIVFSY